MWQWQLDVAWSIKIIAHTYWTFKNQFLKLQKKKTNNLSNLQKKYKYQIKHIYSLSLSGNKATQINMAYFSPTISMTTPGADEEMGQWALSHTPRCQVNLSGEQFEYTSKALCVYKPLDCSFESWEQSQMVTPKSVRQTSRFPGLPSKLSLAYQ